MKDCQRIPQEVRTRFARFIETRVNPGAAERDRTMSGFPRELLQEASAIGLIGFTAPKEVGGGGRSIREWGYALEEIGYLCTDAGLPALLSYRESATNLICQSGNRELIERYVPSIVRGETYVAWAYSEGKDPFNFTTTIQDGDGCFIVNGEKFPIAGGQAAHAFVVYCLDETKKDLVVAVVNRDDPGVAVSPVPTMGLRSMDMGKLTLTEARIPRDRILVSCDGVSHAQILLNERRITGICWVVGRMRALLETLTTHMGSRIRYRLPLTEMQTVQAALGRMSVSVAAATEFLHAMLEKADPDTMDRLWDPQAAMTKYFLTAQAIEVAQTAQQILGGYGYMTEYEFERYLRDFYALVPIFGAQYTLEVDLGIYLTQKLQFR